MKKQQLPDSIQAIDRQGYWRTLVRDVINQRYLYLLLLPGMVYFFIFRYMPIAGLQLAFKKYSARLGIWGSSFVGLQNFRKLFLSPDFIHVFFNTLIVSAGRLIVEFPFPIVLAILLSELRLNRTKKLYQTLYTFPYFLSWVVVGSILTTFFSIDGPMNALIVKLGGSEYSFLSEKTTFRWLLYVTDIWKNAGWSSIIYIAAITGINPDLYEAAQIDGAGRWQCVLHITLTGILPTILIMFILQVGRVMDAGFDQIFNMYNSAVYSVSDIIDTYIYRVSFISAPDFGYSTAIGLFKSVINLVLVLGANYVSRFVSDDRKGALLQ